MRFCCHGHHTLSGRPALHCVGRRLGRAACCDTPHSTADPQTTLIMFLQLDDLPDEGNESSSASSPLPQHG